MASASREVECASTHARAPHLDRGLAPRSATSPLHRHGRARRAWGPLLRRLRPGEGERRVRKGARQRAGGRRRGRDLHEPRPDAGGRHKLFLNGRVRKAAKIAPGDRVKVTLAKGSRSRRGKRRSQTISCARFETPTRSDLFNGSPAARGTRSFAGSTTRRRKRRARSESGEPSNAGSRRATRRSTARRRRARAKTRRPKSRFVIVVHEPLIHTVPRGPSAPFETSGFEPPRRAFGKSCSPRHHEAVLENRARSLSAPRAVTVACRPLRATGSGPGRRRRGRSSSR